MRLVPIYAREVVVGFKVIAQSSTEAELLCSLGRLKPLVYQNGGPLTLSLCPELPYELCPDAPARIVRERDAAPANQT